MSGRLHRACALACLAVVTALSATPAAAQNLYWNSSNSTTGPSDGAGVWLSGGNWWNGTANTTWSSGANATFGVGVAGGAVTLSANTTVDSIKFNYFTGTYTLGTSGAGSTITLNNGITKNAGPGTATIISPITLGAAQSWVNNNIETSATAATAFLNATGGINLNGNALTIDGTGTMGFHGTANIISGAGGIIKNGAGVLILGAGGTSPLNTYTGGTVINGGVVRFQAADTPGTSGSFGAGGITLNGGIIEGYSGNSMTGRSLGNGANQIQILGGTSGFSGQGSSATTFTIGTSGSTLVWGTAGQGSATGFFNPTTFVLLGSTVNTNGKLTLNNGIDLNGTTRTIASLGGDTTGGATVTGAIIDSQASGAGLNKTGSGNLILTANNTYTGATTVTGGSVPTVAGAYSGAITLSGSGAINSTSGITLTNGSLILINTAQVNRVADGAAITSSGSNTITYTNTSGANVYTETIGAITHSAGQLNLVLTNDQTSTGNQTLTIGTGGLSRSGTSALTFSAGGTGPQVSGSKNMIVVTGAGTTTAGEVIGPWATTGTTAALQTDYAVYNSNYVVGSGIAATSNDSTWSTTWAAGSNYNFDNSGGNLTLSTTRNVNTLRRTGSTAETLTVAANANLGTYGILNGATTLFTIAATGNGTVTLPTTSAGQLYVTTGSGGITISAPVSDNTGKLTLVKSGTGTLLLNAANNPYSGDTIVNGGTLQFGTGNPSVTTLLNGGSYGGNIFIAGGATLSFQGNGNNTLSGNITGDGNLNLMRGVTTLSGNNSYTGKTVIGLVTTNGNSNTVNVSSFNSVVGGTATSSLGAATTVANGTIDFGGGVQQTVTINYTGSGETTDRILNFFFNSSGTRVMDSSATGVLKFTSTPTSNGTTTGSVTLQGSGNGEFTNGLPFAFTNFTKSGAGTWTLGGAVGSTGTVTVSANGGTLALQQRSSLMGGNNANWTAAKVIVNSGATLAVNVGGSNEFGTVDVTTLLTNLGGLGGAINNNGLRSGSTIGFDTTNASGGSFTIADALANSTGTGGGAIGVVKRGTGSLVLTANNTYTGITTVSAGTLQIGNNTTSGSISNTASVSNNGSLVFYRSDNLSVGYAISGNGSVTKQGAGTLSLTVANSYTGGTNINAGTLSFASGALGSSGNITFTGNSSLQWAPSNTQDISARLVMTNGVVSTLDTNFNSPVTFASSIGNSSSGSLTKAGAGTLALQNNTSYTGTTTIDGGTLQVEASIASSSGIVNNSQLLFLSSVAQAYGNVISGNGSLTLNSSDTLTLSGNNTYSGPTTIQFGTLQIGNGGTSGSLATSGVTIADSSGFLVFNRNDANSVGYAIDGNGSVVQAGTGTTTLTGNNTYFGLTNVNAGTLTIGGSGSINNTFAINVADGARLAYNSSVALAVAPTLNGAGETNRAVFGGSGTISAALTLDDVGDVLSPGNSPGIQNYDVDQSWDSFSYDWELNNWTTSTPGSTMDQITVTINGGNFGTLNLTGVLPNTYILNVLSLTGGNATGGVDNFSDTNNSWTVLTTDGGITGFDASTWTINATDFMTQNPSATGNFSLSLVNGGKDLLLSYVVVPEPAAIALASCGLIGLGLAARRRMRRTV